MCVRRLKVHGEPLAKNQQLITTLTLNTMAYTTECYQFSGHTSCGFDRGITGMAWVRQLIYIWVVDFG